MTSDYPSSGPSLEERLRDVDFIEDAVARAVRDALQMHKRLGNLICAWRNGQVVWIKPEDIPAPEEFDGDKSR